MNSLVLIGAGCLIALMPLALYFLFLAYLNQRGRPTMLSGPWDFACLLLGLSGFIIIGGPVLLAIVDSAWRSYWFGGNFARLRDVWHAAGILSTAIAGGYLLLLFGLITGMLVWRRKFTLIYNLEPGALQPMLVAAINASNLVWRRELGGIEMAVRRSQNKVSDEGDDGEFPTRARLVGPSAFVRIDSFPAFQHANLTWYDADPRVRLEVEAELEKQLQAAETSANPAAGWFMTAAVVMFLVMLAWMGFLIYTIVVSRKGV